MVVAMAEADDPIASIQTSVDEGETVPLTSEDLQILAEKVFALIKEELRVERERRGGRGGI